MKINVCFLAGAVLLLGVTLRADMQKVSFYEVKPTARAPVIDGRMSDPLWETVRAHTNYYEYFKPAPDPSVLKSEFRMLYDARGVYLGIRNYDDNIAGLRTNITDDGNVQVWTDDCAELYFGGSGHGGGFRCFKSNAIGTTTEMNRLDTAVVVGEWQGTGWFVKTSIHEDQWILEGFFPWEDIGMTAKAGDILRFCHVRYAYTSGKFQGATSSPGGNYASTDAFGYLYLGSDSRVLDPSDVAKLLGTAATPPWGLAVGKNLISDLGEGPRIEPLAEVVSAAAVRLIEVNRLVTEAMADTKAATFSKEHAEMQAASQVLTERTDVSFSGLQALQKQINLLEDFYMLVKLETEFN